MKSEFVMTRSVAKRGGGGGGPLHEKHFSCPNAQIYSAMSALSLSIFLSIQLVQLVNQFSLFVRTLLSYVFIYLLLLYSSSLFFFFFFFFFGGGGVGADKCLGAAIVTSSPDYHKSPLSSTTGNNGDHKGREIMERKGGGGHQKRKIKSQSWCRTHRILLPVLRRTHCGMGRFCFCFLASFCLMRNVLWEGCK